MPDLYIFKAQVGMADPVALQNHNVIIHYAKNTYYRRVDYVGGIPEFQCANLGAVLAANQTGRVNIVNLELADNEFGIFRWYPLDDVQILLFHPSGISKYQLRNLQVPVDAAILANDPNLVSTEIGVWEDNRPAMIAINGHAFAMPASRIRAIGYRFHTVDMENVVDVIGLNHEEKSVIAGLRAEYPNNSKKDKDLMEIALKEGLLRATHIWCSGRAIGD
jgi:hypothetical protein